MTPNFQFFCKAKGGKIKSTRKTQAAHLIPQRKIRGGQTHRLSSSTVPRAGSNNPKLITFVRNACDIRTSYQVQDKIKIRKGLIPLPNFLMVEEVSYLDI